MIIDLREMQELQGRLEGDVSTRFDDPVAGELFVPCRVAVDYRQSQGVYYLHGSVEADVAAVCHRCLEALSVRVTGTFDVMVRRGEDAGPAGDDVILLGPHEYEVALEPLVHETVVVNTPMVIACREECRGLCPSCGTNLNTGTCACGTAGDSRWEALRKMKLE